MCDGPGLLFMHVRGVGDLVSGTLGDVIPGTTLVLLKD
jgi:hypothetical protein